MKRIIYILFAFLGCLAYSNAQAQSRNVGIGTNTPDNSAILDISSSSKGLLIPRLTAQQVNAISNPATGLMVFRTGENQGFFFFNGKDWAPLTNAEANAIAADPNDWSFGGNAVPAGAFIGTTNNQHLVFKVNNNPAGRLMVNGSIFVGVNSGLVTTAESNVGLGSSTLRNNTTGLYNMAIGTGSLEKNVVGNSNVAIGNSALHLLNGTAANGSANVAIGTNAMNQKLTGLSNVAIGHSALQGAISSGGDENVALGRGAGQNYAGNRSVFIGFNAGQNESASNKLYIGNSNTTMPLLYGDFSAKFVSIGDVPLAKRDAIASSGQYSLLVEKGILSEKLKVALKSTGDWADYVFEPEYKTTMLSLEEVEAFTIKNKHLPNVPSAEELVNKGLDFNETSKMFMEKIEELTLYMIELNKEVKALKAENALLKEAVNK